MAYNTLHYAHKNTMISDQMLCQDIADIFMNYPPSTFRMKGKVKKRKEDIVFFFSILQ